MKRQVIRLTDIKIGDRLRKDIDEKTVAGIMDSIQRVGLQNPISVLKQDGDFILAAGLHRREAAMRLGTDELECVVFDDASAARLWELSENLHRSDLSALERDAHIAEYIRLTEAKPVDAVSRQPDAKQKAGRPEGGTRAAARELGISEPDARRAKAVDSLSSEAKKAAKEKKLDNNRSVLLKAAKATTPAAQVAVIQGHASKAKQPVRDGGEGIAATALAPTSVASATPLPPENGEEVKAAANAALRALRTPQQWADVASMNAEEWRAAMATMAARANPSDAATALDSTYRVAAAHKALCALSNPAEWNEVAAMNEDDWKAAAKSLDVEAPAVPVPAPEAPANTNSPKAGPEPAGATLANLEDDPWIRKRFPKDAA
jgi:ParB family chromosome partitioning protein